MDVNLRNANWRQWVGRLGEGERRQGGGLGSYGHNTEASRGEDDCPEHSVF